MTDQLIEAFEHGVATLTINAAENVTLSEVLGLEALHMVRTMMTDDHTSAAQAFVETRAPVFAGR